MGFIARNLLRAMLAALLSTHALVPAMAADGSTLARIQSSGELKVCIWPDYYSITYRNPRTQQLSGLDIDLSVELARELGVKPSYVESSFSQLITDVTTARCDVAMFAVGVLPQREAKLAFTKPYLQSDIYAVTTHSNRMVREWSDIDHAGVVVAVQADTFMDPVMRGVLKQAQLTVVRQPDTRERELESGRVDVFMTDFPYSRRLLDSADWAKLIAPPRPFHVIPYAYAVRQGDQQWLGRLDEFVAAIKRDGRLKEAAARHGLSQIVVD